MTIFFLINSFYKGYPSLFKLTESVQFSMIHIYQSEKGTFSYFYFCLSLIAYAEGYQEVNRSGRGLNYLHFVQFYIQIFQLQHNKYSQGISFEMTKNSKGQRYSKNCLRIRGRQELFIKGEVLVNFAALPKKYSFHNVEKTSGTLLSFQPLIEMQNITPQPSAYLLLNLKQMRS